MVGSLDKAGQLVALVRVDNLVYQVRPGNYLGQNYGRIMKVSETEIVLREIVQDAAGEWIERPASDCNCKRGRNEQTTTTTVWHESGAASLPLVALAGCRWQRMRRTRSRQSLARFRGAWR